MVEEHYTSKVHNGENMKRIGRPSWSKNGKLNGMLKTEDKRSRQPIYQTGRLFCCNGLCISNPENGSNGINDVEWIIKGMERAV